jgi:uncharacterized protein YpmB
MELNIIVITIIGIIVMILSFSLLSFRRGLNNNNNNNDAGQLWGCATHLQENKGIEYYRHYFCVNKHTDVIIFINIILAGPKS